MEGWIKLHRSFWDLPFYKEKRPLTRREAWEDILLLVNHKDSKVLIHGSLIECKKGQSVMSLSSWAERFRWSIKKFRNYLELLKAEGLIVTEGLQKTTRLTICNYGIYQDIRADKGQTKGRQRADKGQTKGRQRATNKNGKKEKNDKKGKNINPPPLFFVSQNFITVWEKWLAYRNEMKKPYRTETGAITKYNQLVKLSDNNPDKALLIIDQSIGNEWTGFFPLKTNSRHFKNAVPGEDSVERMIRVQKEYFAKQKKQAEDEKISDMIADLEIENLLENGTQK